MDDRIHIIRNTDPMKIFIFNEDKRQYAFSMCNPPFYASTEEIEEGLSSKKLEPYAVCCGSTNEMITEGGEVGFIGRMIEESVHLKKRVRWYTSMIGLKRSIRPLIRLLKHHDISNYTVTEFSQGKTTRWGIGWSFYAERITKSRSLDIYRPKYQFETELPKEYEYVSNGLKEILMDLEVEHTEKEEGEWTITGNVYANTWSRSARRKRRRTETSIEDKKLLFTFEFIIYSTVQGHCCVQINWLKGIDRSSFEGFWSHVKKRLEEQCGIVRGSQYKHK